MNATPHHLLIPLLTTALCAIARAKDSLITYESPKDGRASLAIYDAGGRLVRTLLTGAPQAAGKHTATWDGLDRYGNALPAGEYEWRLLQTEGLRAEFITQVGQNVDPVWERATGNHESPNAVAVDPTGLYRIGATNEGAHWGVKTDLDGRHLWTNDRWFKDPWVQNTAAVTLVGERLFELLPNGHVYGYHATTGRVFTGGDFDPKPWVFRIDPEGAADKGSDEEKRRAARRVSPIDLAGDASNGLPVAAYPQFNTIEWRDAGTGEVVDRAEGIAGLAGIAVVPDGRVCIIAGGAVLTLDRKNKTPRILIPADRMSEPTSLSVSPVSGDFFVASATRVWRFDPSGKPIAVFGTPGGRKDGAYIPTDFLGITDIEADHEGGFVITEGKHTPPRRSARFTADGKLLREWFGAQHYGVIACPEPGDPRHVWTRANADVPGLIRWEVDYQNKTSRPVEIYQRSFTENPLLRGNNSHGSTVPTVFQHDGRTYIYNGGQSSLTIYLYDPKAKTMRATNGSTDQKKRAVLWNDINDDGQASDDEFSPLRRPMIGGHIDPADFTLRLTPFGSKYDSGYRLKPVRITAGGTPVFEWSAAVKVTAWTENGEEFRPYDFRPGADGSWYGSFAESAKNPHEGTETHGAWYYNSCSAVDRVVKWDTDGKQVWSVGRHSPDNDHETGSTAMARGLVGFTHGCIVQGDASDEETCRPVVWTEDGLYVDEMLRVPIDRVPKLKYGEDNTNEYPTGHLFTDPKTGETLFFAMNSGGGAPIYRITGWDGWHRASGKITLTAPATNVAKRDGTGLRAEYFNNADCSGEPALTRTDNLVFFNWAKDGPDKAITADTFSVRWSGSYEAATNEDVRFEIRGSFPWRDKGRPQWAKLWLGGQLVFDSKAGIGSRDSTFNQDGSTVGNVRVKLRAGERVDLRMECGFKKGAAAIALNHDTPGLDRRAVLPAFLHPEPGPKRAMEIAVEKRCEVIADFAFEEKDGVISRSRAGGDVFGRLTGDTRRVPGKSGNGIEFEAKSEFAPTVFPIDEELRLPDTDYTVAFWFKTTAKDIRLCEAKRYSSYNNRWSDHVVQIEGGKLQFRLQGDEPLTTSTAVNDDAWHHVVTTVGEGGQRLHLDGKLIGTGKLAKRTKNSNRLGLDLGPGDGRGVVTMDELRVFGRALTPAEAENLPR